MKEKRIDKVIDIAIMWAVTAGILVCIRMTQQAFIVGTKPMAAATIMTWVMWAALVRFHAIRCDRRVERIQREKIAQAKNTEELVLACMDPTGFWVKMDKMFNWGGFILCTALALWLFYFFVFC